MKLEMKVAVVAVMIFLVLAPSTILCGGFVSMLLLCVYTEPTCGIGTA